MAVEGLDEQRPARIGEVKRLGERPTVALTKITKALRARSKIIGLEHRTKCLAVGGCDWMQIRIGQAATWFPTPDDILPAAHGGGANGQTNPEAVLPRVPPVD